MATILVVDDDAAIRETAALALEKAGYDVRRAASVAEAISLLAQAPVDLVLSDIYMPGEDGLSLLSRLREGPSPPKIVLMTARGTIETATIAARLGVTDYVAKPFDLANLLGRIAAALAPPAAGGEAVDPEGPRSLIVGSHPAMVEVYNAVARVARLPVTVLVLGETGTGKELVARALHQFGARSDGPFVAVHCGAIPDTLLESELFGHVRGAFTGADRDRRGSLREAQHGTVFLDEIGDVSPSFQTKLLRFLQEKTVRPVGAERSEPVDVRVVAATHRDLAALSAAGSFRQDLYFRLAGYEVRLPALRERLSDLPLLVEHFRAAAVREMGLPETSPASSAVLAAFAAHSWPGNVRELEQVVRRLLIDTGALSDAAATARFLASSARAATPATPDVAPAPQPRESVAAGLAEPLQSLDEMERRHILEVLGATGGNRSAAARILGIERKTLSRKLKAWGTPDPDGDDSGSV
ncbi:MAG TPA: sigma-54 dependent transcriptional regulator [Thermoanaerobaculia bacterium]|nr:sigma-54 dependent transcriptional regulator [Thermoanaerobaculia bacterium]